jgi:hypothetical protein
MFIDSSHSGELCTLNYKSLQLSKVSYPYSSF